MVVLELLQYLQKGKELILCHDIADDFPPLWADEHRVEQILINLVGNSVKFTDSGRICLEAVVHDQRAVIRVCDTGVGIAEDLQDRIFEPFQHEFRDFPVSYKFDHQ